MFGCLQVLEGKGLEYWMDFGTLLGACRDSSFIEWDSDIDFGIFPNQVGLIVGLKQEFKNAGFEMEVISYRGKVHQVHLYRQIPSVNFNVYHEGGEHYWSLWLVPNNDISRANSRLAHQKGYMNKVYRSAVKMARFLIPKHVISRLFRDKIVVTEVPRSFFDRQEEISFMGHRFCIPGDRETYLEFRYGEDWKTPRQDWVYWRDDGAVTGAQGDPPALLG